MSIDLSQFQDSFFEEAAEHLTTIEDGLLQLEQHPQDLDLLNRIFRAAHSIKGNSGMFGLIAVGHFTHKMETLLDRLRNGQISVTPAIADVLLRSTDCLKALIEAARSGAAVDEETINRLSAELDTSRFLAEPARGTGALLSGACPPQVTGTGTAADGRSQSPAQVGGGEGWGNPSSVTQYRIAWTPPAWLFQRGLDPLQMFKELGDLGRLLSVTVDTSRLPDLPAMDPEQCYLSWTLDVETSKDRAVLEGVFEFVREDSVLDIVEHAGAGHEARGGARDGVQGERPGGEVLPTTSPVPLAPSLVSAGLSPLAPGLSPAAIGGGEPKPLGEILVESGVVSRETLDKALSQQKRVGEILIEQKAATPQQISQALQKQQDSAAHSKKGTDAASIRVDTGKIDKLINLVGELVITQSMLSDLSTRFEMSQLAVLLERIAQLERNTREIQERVMGIRMLPIGNAFSRFPRLVRDLSGKAGKKIQLLLSGEETELDKTVIESIGDPLTHLVRNSADHGLEPPEERIAAGKPEQGTIRLNAFHEGGNICITVEDDGRGLNREKILAKAIKQGLITESDKLSDDHIWPLIFRPGFSTAEQVTDVSGRGVGMDVVKRNIEGLGGTVIIKTVAGKGTTFTLKLPLTLAIIEGMTVRVGQDTYIVPLLSILESIQPKQNMIKTLVGKGELVNVRGTYLPMIRLYDMFCLHPEITDPTAAILLILEAEGERVSVMVDEILGQQQVVIKSMEQNFRKVEGVAGATILGDGTVGFILDVRGLLEIARRGTPAAA